MIVTTTLHTTTHAPRAPLTGYDDPQQFVLVIEDHGVSAVDRWSGYRNEPRCHGGELVVAFP